MYYLLYFKTENLTPEEMSISKHGGVWLHTGVQAETKEQVKEISKRLIKSGQGYFGLGCKTKIAAY